MAKKDWIKGAINPKNKGVFRRAAEAHHMTTKAYAKSVISQYKGKKGLTSPQKTLLRRAVLAKTLMGFK